MAPRSPSPRWQPCASWRPAWRSSRAGGLWRLVQVVFGAATLGLWLLGAGYYLVYLFGWLQAVDMGALAPLLGGVVAVVLTIPAVAYLRSLALWRRARVRGALAGSGGPG